MFDLCFLLPVFFFVLFFSGALAFFFFTRKIPIFQEEVPSLNYFWVPPLVRITAAVSITDSTGRSSTVTGNNGMKIKAVS